MSRQRGKRVQFAWIFVAVFLLINVYWWSFTPPTTLFSPLYWLGYAAWGAVGGWGLLPKDFNASKTRVNPILVGLVGVAVVIAWKINPIFAPLFFSLVGIFAGMAIRGAIYLGTTSVPMRPFFRYAQDEPRTNLLEFARLRKDGGARVESEGRSANVMLSSVCDGF